MAKDSTEKERGTGMANARDKEDSWERGYKELDVLYQRTKRDVQKLSRELWQEKTDRLALERQLYNLRTERVELMPAKVLNTKTETHMLPGREPKPRLHSFETREYPPGTLGGRYQMWIDGRFAKDITRETEAKAAEEAAPAPESPQPAPPSKPEVLSFLGRDDPEGPDGRSAAAERAPRRRRNHTDALLQQLQQLREN